MSTISQLPVDSPIFEDDDVPATAAELTEFLDEDGYAELPAFPNPLRNPLRSIAWCVRYLFGIASMIVLLAVLAVVPVVNFLALGYLLEAEGRVARTGRLRKAFHLIDIAPRLGSIALGLWLWTIPLRLLAGVASDAAVISPGGDVAGRWQTATAVASVLVGLHLVLALARGGTVGCFFRPLKNILWLRRQWMEGGYWERADQHVRKFVGSMRLKYHFLLGVKGFFGALPWLVPPTLMFAAANSSQGGPIIVTLLGGIALVVVFGWMPFLQAHVAATGKIGAYRQLRTSARRIWAHAPVAAFFAVLLTFALSLPLNLLKIKLLPRDAMWVATLVFIVSIYPARIFTGWAYSRGMRPEKPRAHWAFRWGMRILSVGALVAYTAILFFVQDVSEHGKLALFEHHAFLLPVPF